MKTYKFTNHVNGLQGELNEEMLESAIKTWKDLGYKVYLNEQKLEIHIVQKTYVFSQKEAIVEL